MAARPPGRPGRGGCRVTSFRPSTPFLPVCLFFSFTRGSFTLPSSPFLTPGTVPLLNLVPHTFDPTFSSRGRPQTYLLPFLSLAVAFIFIDIPFLTSGIVPTTPGYHWTCTGAPLFHIPTPQPCSTPPASCYRGPANTESPEPAARRAPHTHLGEPGGAVGRTALVPQPLPPPLSPERHAASRPLGLFGPKLTWKKRERGRQEREERGAGSRTVGPEGAPRKAKATRHTCSSSRSAERLWHRGPMAVRAGGGSGRTGLGQARV